MVRWRAGHAAAEGSVHPARRRCEVFLEAFEGPLDLLLYLIRRQNLDILDIPIADITRAVHGVHRPDGRAAARARRRIPGDGRDAGRDQVAHAAAARRRSERRRRERSARRPGAPPAGVRALQDARRENIDRIPRMERDTWIGNAELGERKSSRPLPQVAMQEMLLAFRDVVQRAEMFAHHHVQRERLSVRVRMSDILATLERSSFVEFVNLFKPEEGRMGVTVTFVAILELVREGLIDIVQTEAYAPLRTCAARRARAGCDWRWTTTQLRRCRRQRSATPPTDRCWTASSDPGTTPAAGRANGRRRSMSDAYFKNVVEAALLAAARPVSIAELLQIFDEQSRPSPKEMRAMLE